MVNTDSEHDRIAIRIMAIVADALRRPVDDITLEAHLDARDLGIDSLGLIKLSVAIEEAFDVAMPDFTSLDESPLGSVGDLVRFVSDSLAARGASLPTTPGAAADGPR